MRRRLAWTVGLFLLAAAALAGAQARGRAARHLYEPRDRAGRVAVVRDAADAFRAWQAAGVHGRRLVLLTGQWSRPRDEKAHGAAEAAPPRPVSAEPDKVDAKNAIYMASRLGVSRILDVVMPPAAFTHRLGEVRGAKELVKEDGAFRLAYNGLERRFSTPRAFEAPGETVLVLVEPSWFQPGAPADPLGWLTSRGVSWDLAVLALEDPAATGDARLAALAFARSAGASFPGEAR